MAYNTSEVGKRGQARDVLDGAYEPVGYQQITSLSSAVGFTVPTASTIALVQAEDQNVRWRDDGTNPTGSVGMRLFANSDLLYNGDLNKIKFIEETASATLNITYFR